MGVADRGVEAGLGQTHGAGGDRETALVDGAHRDDETLAFLTDPVLDRDRHVVEVDDARVAGPDAQLAVEGPGRQAVHSPLEHEGRDALVLLRPIDRCEDEEVVGQVGEADPDLLAIEPVGIAVSPSRRRQVARVRAHPGLGEAECRQLLALRLRHEPALSLLLCPPLQEGEAVQPDMDALDDTERRVGPFQLLAQDREADVVHARPAVGLRDRRAQKPELAHPAEDLAVDLALLVPFTDVGQDLGLGERAGAVRDEPVLVGEAEVDHRAEC